MPRCRTASRAALIAGLLGLAGCAGLRGVSVPDRQLPTAWEARRSALQAWPGYDLRGRIAVARGDDGFSGALRWVQTGAKVRLELDGPLGVGGARYELDPTSVDGAAFEQALGVPVPVASLRYWLLGVPDPALAAEESLESGAARLAALQQAGWSVVYTRYATVPGTRLELPQRIEVTREAVRLRLLVEGWQGVRP
ncbi:MAG: lipoprotein insertase outer membrane protein LolB [Gammaproteobacteria bacterium]